MEQSIVGGGVEEKSCKVSVGLLLPTLSPTPNVLNISLRNIFPNLLVAVPRQLKIPRSLLFARGEGGGGGGGGGGEGGEEGEAFYVLAHMRGKAFPLQIMKLSYSAFALLAFLPTLKGSFSEIHQIKSSHLTPHPPPNCSTKCIF